MFFESILVLSFFGDPAHKIILNGALELGKPAYKKVTINPVFTRFIAFLLRKMGLEQTVSSSNTYRKEFSDSSLKSVTKSVTTKSLDKKS